MADVEGVSVAFVEHVRKYAPVADLTRCYNATYVFTVMVRLRHVRNTSVTCCVTVRTNFGPGFAMLYNTLFNSRQQKTIIYNSLHLKRYILSSKHLFTM